MKKICLLFVVVSSGAALAHADMQTARSGRPPADARPAICSNAMALSAQIDLYLEQGKYAEAEPLATCDLANSEKLFPDSIIVATSLNRLAGIHKELRKYATAETMYKRALAIRERDRG